MEMVRSVIALQPLDPCDLPRTSNVVTLRAATMSRRTITPARLANRKIGWYGHVVVYASSGLLLLVVAPLVVVLIIMLSWGIALATHGFFAVAAPMLRQRWADEEHAPPPGARLLESRRARSLEQLSASIAHEIRNPITAAKSLVAQMGEDPQRPENVEYARVALEELDRVERSIAHLLRFARDEELDVREVDLAQMMGSALETLESRIADGQVTVTRDFGEAGRLHADAEKLRRVVINLVGNALDALAGSGTTSDPRVDVAAGQNLAETEVWIRVRDNGPGIPKDKLEAIFAPFHTTKDAGTGLGLALSRKVIEAHGGTLEAKESARGAELVVVLPKIAKVGTVQGVAP
jgi:signal transduction histidine kinase